MLSALFAVLFGLSLLPGRKPVCLRFAERISDGILPDGAVAYCRRLTWVWFFVLLLGACSSLALARGLGPCPGWCAFLVSPVLFALTFAIEKPIRNRRFRVVFHTSGSTGRSKTIIKRFETLAKEVAMHRRWCRERFATAVPPVDPKDVVFLGTVQWDHMYGKLWMDLLPKALGVPADPEVILSPEHLIAKMRAARRVFLVTTPSFLDRFTSYADQYEVPQNCVEIVTSGAALPPEVGDRTLRVFGIRPRQIFGSTETGGVAWMREPGPARVFDGVTVGERDGRLLVKSPFSFRRTYLMGDGVELSPDRRSFRLLGRRDRLVKINEERVNLAEMEEKVRALGWRDCALVKLTGEHGDFLGLVLAGTGPTNALELRRRFLDVFPRGTVPKKFRVVPEIPKNTQGKVLKSELEKMF